ncbi:TrmH family RNA methyltransferase [Streptomyces tsukubensis]|uniref:rRNA methyltransferase n=1 Tax=Streptomyces tsukubensis TaxID=83656 RepID=A0A1V4AFM2_9ACTN|nr:RNA methyltransferase [Streptomyces tsukubensis]OON82159.1 rRNA methyltransferase [Streptomyces tsukubensis]QFR92645.1 rRNA methyltransferase [Streptomyces tsukubensis]
MAELQRVDDPDDPGLHDYTGLTDVELRRRREPEEGLFIAEGEKVIRRALRAGYAMRSMLLTEKWTEVMRDVIEETAAPVHLAEPAVAERITGYHVHRGALASMHREPLPPLHSLLTDVHRSAAVPRRNTPMDEDTADEPSAPEAGRRPVRRVAVFEDIVDHANMGAAFRNAAALGVDAVLLTPRCADPLYRRSVKVSMGAVFHVPWTRLDSWPGDMEILRSEGFTVVALCLSDRAITLDELAARDEKKLALVFGTEGDGLARGTLAAADEHVRIPMGAGVDSLNVAAASAVAFYATRPTG